MFKQHKPKIIAIIVIAIISIAVFSYVNYLMGIPLDIEIPTHFTYNNTKIALAWTDDNTNETLIIQSDKKEYNGFNSVDVYFSITNINKRDQDMDVVVWLPSEKAKVNKVERISEDGSNFEFPISNFQSISNFQFPNRKDVGGSSNGYAVNDEIESGETNYYKATIKYPFKSKGEFFIEAFGGEKEAKPLRFALANRRGLASSAYGHLDPWYSSDWSYKREITINASQIATTTSAFPVLAATTLADLKTTTHGGKVGNDNGYDIVFVDDDDSTILNYEREKYASTTGEIAYWIKTDISSTVDKTIYMYYGNASAADQATTTGVWDSSYKGVWHMNQDPSAASTTDSTINSNDGTTGGSMTSGDLVNGEIGQAIDFDGADDLINCGKNSSLNGMGTLTWQAWIYPRSRGEGNDDAPAGRIINKLKRFFMEDIAGGSRHIGLTAVTSPLTYRLSTNDINYSTQWHHVLVTWDGTSNYTGIDLYIDGALSNSGGGGTGSLEDDSSYDLIIGNLSDQTRTFDGIIDEVRVSNVARSAGWIQTEYNNQSDVGSFMAFGAEVNSNTIILSDHTAGQEADSFTDNGGETDAELFAFKFANTGENINVQQAVFSLSETAGLTNGDWSGVEIIVDDNNDGSIGAGETTSVGGAGAVDMSANTITFSTQFTVSQATGYILRADFSSLSDGDKFTISLTAGNITAVGAVSAESSISTGSAESVTHIEADISWYSSDWSYKREITINASQIATTTSAFPVLATSTEDYLKTTTFGGKIENDNGYDIIFVDDDDSTLLNYEREYYASTTGEIAYWIKTDISSTTDKTIYMYYGKSGASDLATTTGVWDDNFVMVQHLQETPAGTTYDSTSNDNDGTTYNMDSADQVAGQIDGSLDFDGGDDVINLGSNSSTDNIYPITISCWLNISLDTSGDLIIQKDSGREWYIKVLSASTNRLTFFKDNSGGDINVDNSSSNFYNLDEWVYAVFTWDGVCPGTVNTNAFWYKNGQNVAAIGNILGTIETDAEGDLKIGDETIPFDGIIDEVRISNTARTAGWIATEYNNQVSVGSFLTIGEEEGLQLSITTDPKVIITGTETSAFTVQAQNLSGNEMVMGNAVTVNLSSDSSGTYHFTATPGGVHITTVTIPQGSSSVNFYYTDYKPGSPTITVSATNFTSDTQQQMVQGVWQDTAYQCRRQITINSSQISTTTSNFPVLATTTLANLKTATNGGKVQNDNGYDIIFVDDDDSTLLNYEREYYASTTGEIAYWIKTDISSTTDKTIYMYYGKSGASDLATTTGVWDDNFVMVQHLQETPAGTTYDSTSNNNDGTTYNMDSADQVAGQIDGSLDFDGGNDYVNYGTGASLYPTGWITISGWVKTTTGMKIVVSWDGADRRFMLNDNNFIFRTTGDLANTYRVFNTSNTDGQWHYLSAVSNPTNTIINLYRDGALDNGALTDNGAGWCSDKPYVNTGFQTPTYFAGKVDEVRISNVARTAGWIATEYNNQSDVGSFLTIGAETSKNPVVTTNTVTKIASTIATANGNITNIGSGIVTTRGFKYGLTETDTWSVSEAGSFNANVYKLDIPSLTPGTTYYIRAFATNSEGTSYGSYVSFITLSNQTGSPIIFKRNVILKENMILK